jgi:glycerol-3-phosphate dehydrogenase
MFVLPWGRFTYIGTTDTEFLGDPDDVVADARDVSYLLTSTNFVFPKAALTERDVLSTWAGVRPLLAPDDRGSASPSGTSREHEIWRDASGILNVAGGKLTTFRSMAAETAEIAADILDEEFGVRSGPYFTEYLPLPGAPEREGPGPKPPWLSRAAKLGLDPQTIDHLNHRYGADVTALLDLLSAEPQLSQRIVADQPYIEAEVVHAVRSEMALTLEDVLRRRLQLFYEATDGGLPATARLAARIGSELGWTAVRIEEELNRYAGSVARTRPGMS